MCKFVCIAAARTHSVCLSWPRGGGGCGCGVPRIRLNRGGGCGCLLPGCLLPGRPGQEAGRTAEIRQSIKLCHQPAQPREDHLQPHQQHRDELIETVAPHRHCGQQQRDSEQRLTSTNFGSSAASNLCRNGYGRATWCNLGQAGNLKLCPFIACANVGLLSGSLRKPATAGLRHRFSESVRPPGRG